jgi:hypothetical protein
MKNCARNSKKLSDSFCRLLGIFVLSIGLAGFAVPGLSQSPSPLINDSLDKADSSRPPSSWRMHRIKTTRPAASQPSPAQANGLDGAKEASAEKSGNAVPQQNGQQQQHGPKIWLQDSKRLATTFRGGASSIARGSVGIDATNLAQNNAVALLIAAGQAQPLSMLKGDFDQDGIEDLVAGYSTSMGGAIVFYRGNLDAFAPQSDASLRAIGRGDFPSPFLPDARVFKVPVNPDFIATGNFIPGGFQDIAIGARGGNALYVLPGDGKGNFGAPQKLSISGGITALAASEFGNRAQGTKFFVGTTDLVNGFALSVFSLSNGALSELGTYPLSGAASNIEIGYFGDNGPDAVFLSSGQVHILRPSTMQVETASLPTYAVALALGAFIYDRSGGTQIALLAPDGSIQIAARNEFDPHTYTLEEFNSIRQAKVRHEEPPLGPVASFPANGWKIVESFPSAGPVDPNQSQAFFRMRVSSNGADDILWLNGSAGQMVVISHADPQPGANTFIPGQVSIRPYNGSPVAGLPMRINVDGRPGVVALHQGTVTPSILMPIPDPTFFVNRFDDPFPTSPITSACLNVSNVDVSSSCSLREAVLSANALAGTDTIQLAAGTYTLTRGRITSPLYDAHDGTLNINDSLNIVGAAAAGGNPTSIITWGTLTSGNSVDMVMAINEDLSIHSDATASISNVIIENGVNHGTHSVDGDGGCMEFDTGTSGNANLTLTNVIIQNCATLQGGGGGLVAFNFLNHNNNGFVTITNSTIQNNSVVDNPSSGSGGGIGLSNDSHMVMSNSKVLNNKATQVIGGQKGQGGGIIAFFPNGNFTGNPQTAIHSSTISGNEAAGFGGGIQAQADLLIDTGTVISGNVAGTDGTNPVADQEGGGLYLNNFSPASCPAGLSCVATLTKVTIAGNTASGNGGGISNGSGSASGPLTMSFSRLAGNTAAAGSNLNNNNAIATVTNKWWGTNDPSTTINSISATTTFDPFIVLTHTASPRKIRINQSTTLTGDMSLDNHGIGTGLVGNEDVIVGLPITFSNPFLGTIPQAQPETLGNPIPSQTATFNAGGLGGNGSADATVDQQTITANIIVLQPPSIATSFNGTTIQTTAGTGTTSSTITFSITNPNTAPIDASFTDTLPTNLVVAATPAVVNNCGSSVTATAGASSIIFNDNAALAMGTCTIQVNVQSAVDNTYSNSVTIDSTDAGNGNTSSASLTVINPPGITKAFGASTIPLNGTTSLTIVVTSPNVNLTITNVVFADSLPPGLIVASPSNLVSTCSGTATAAAGSSSAILIGASLAPGASCTVSLAVQGTTAGVKNNNVQSDSANAGTGNISSASITVVGPPVIIKAFGAASIPLNGSTSLSFTIQNNNATSNLSNIGFTDTLPAGLVISTPNGLTGNTCSRTPTATEGTNAISLSAAALTPINSCTFSVNVTGTLAGQKNNTTGAVTSTEGGTGGTASASIAVVAPPSIAKSFGSASIPLNMTTTLTLTVTNPAANTVAELGVAFTDTLPTGLVVATPNGLSNSCNGTPAAVAGSTSISLTNGSIAANSTCTLVVNVAGTTSGQYTNTTGSVTSTNGGTGNTGSANLTVATPPTITKAFGAASIPLSGTTSLTFNIANPNAGVPLTGIAFTDNIPAGLVVATPSGLANTCGGVATAVAGSSSLSLAGGTRLASASCTFSINVTGTIAGVKNNVVQVTSTEGGTGNTSNASVTVVSPPVLIKAFGAASIPVNGATTLTFTVQNNNGTSTLTGIGFSDTLPAGLVVATPNGLSGACGGGAITATQATNVISLTGSTLAANASCTFAVNVKGIAAGAQNNTTGNIASVEGGAGGTASANIAVVAPPSIAKTFNPNPISLNTNSTLTFTITNPAANTVAEAGVGFTDTFPAGIVVATPNGLTNTCGGVVTATAGTTSVTLAGGAIPTGASCTIAVTATGTARGNFTNTTGTVASINGGTGNSATASILVVTPDLTISKSHVGNFLLGQIGATYTLTVNNVGLDPTFGTVTAVDVLPTSLTATSISGTGWACILGTLSCTRSDVLAPASSYPPITVTVNVAVNAANPVTNNASVSGGGEANLANDTAADVTIVSTFTITSVPITATIRAGQAAVFTLTITPVGGAVTVPITFTDVITAQKTTLAFVPTQVTPGASPATVVLTIQTTAGLGFVGQKTGLSRAPLAAILFPMGLVVLAGLDAGTNRKNKKFTAWIALVLVISFIGIGLIGCAGNQQSFQNLGTPPGTYPVTVTGSAGGTLQNLNLTLIVQP